MKAIIFLSILFLVSSAYSACPVDYGAYNGEMGCFYGIGSCDNDPNKYICTDLGNEEKPVHYISCSNNRHIKLAEKLIDEINDNDEQFSAYTKSRMIKSIQKMIDACQ